MLHHANSKARLGLFGLLLVAVLFATSGCSAQPLSAAPPTSFDECVQRGYAVRRSLPPQCVAPDGTRYIGPAPSQRDPATELPHVGGPAERACIDLCGNSRCEEVVCMGSGCPCAESAAGCPQDCPA